MRKTFFIMFCIVLTLTGCGVRGKPQVPENDEDLMTHTYPKADYASQICIDGI